MVGNAVRGARNARRSRARRRASSVRGERCTRQYPSCLGTGSADSRRTTLLLGLGSKRKYQYDDAGRLTTQVESNASNVGIYTMVDGYDAVGNRTSRNANGTPCTWSYDPSPLRIRRPVVVRSLRTGSAYRLTGQQKSGQCATFAYDANSNLTLKWHQGGSPQTMQYPSFLRAGSAADRVTTMQVGGTTSTMQWGQRGVPVKLYEAGAIKATYSYADVTNDLTRSEETGTVTTAVFDGDDLRRKTVLSGVTTTFVWDGYDYLQARRSSGGDSLFVVLGGEVVAEVRDGTLRDFLTDPLGSVVAHLDSSQNLTAQFEYWPYGELVGTAETSDLPLLWVGSLGYHTDSTIRTYVRRRAYRQDLGSWTQLDPLWPVLPAMGYAWGSPVNLVDPSGLNALAIGGGLGFALGGPVGAVIGIAVGAVVTIGVVGALTDGGRTLPDLGSISWPRPQQPRVAPIQPQPGRDVWPREVPLPMLPQKSLCDYMEYLYHQVCSYGSKAGNISYTACECTDGLAALALKADYLCACCGLKSAVSLLCRPFERGHADDADAVCVLCRECLGFFPQRLGEIGADLS